MRCAAKSDSIVAETGSISITLLSEPWLGCLLKVLLERGAEDRVAGRICEQASSETRQGLAMHSPLPFKHL